MSEGKLQKSSCLYLVYPEWVKELKEKHKISYGQLIPLILLQDCVKQQDWDSIIPISRNRKELKEDTSHKYWDRARKFIDKKLNGNKVVKKQIKRSIRRMTNDRTK